MGVVCQRGDDGADECAYRNGTYFCNEWIDADPEVIFGGAPSLGCEVRLRVEERPVQWSSPPSVRVFPNFPANYGHEAFS